MPFFFIAPLWLLCVIAGLAILVSKRFRFLASYLILCSTFGFVGSLILSFTAMFFIGEPATMEQLPATILILGFVGGMFVGGVLGILVGGWMAHSLNRRFGLSYSN